MLERFSGAAFTRLYTAAESRALDKLAIEQHGIPGIVLMKRAGRAAWRALRRRWPSVRAITVVCGRGNNAGDGYIVAGSAFAWKGPLRGLFEGQPAPPKVKEAISKWNKSPDMGPGIAGLVFRSEDATGLLKFRAGKVRMRVWEAPLVSGGSCMFIETRDSRMPSVAPGPCAGPLNKVTVAAF